MDSPIWGIMQFMLSENVGLWHCADGVGILKTYQKWVVGDVILKQTSINYPKNAGELAVLL